MNRATALILAMATLLAHTLAIHHDGGGHFAVPYDVAHVAFHLGRMLVRTGEIAWLTVGDVTGGLESYPSPLWVGVSAMGEQLYLPITLFCQVIGILAAVSTFALSARFATDRIVGVIPPVLLVVSGGMAAAAASGTEIPLLALFLTGAFVSFEHRWHRILSFSLFLLVLTRPEGVLMALAFLLLAGAERFLARRDGSAPTPLGAFLPAAIATLVLVIVGRSDGGSLYGTQLALLLSFDGPRAETGLIYLWDFCLTTATPLLLVFPLVMLVVGKLSGAGLRALLLFGFHAFVVVLGGGGHLPFSMEMVPVVPIMLVAVQQGVIAALDLKGRFIEVLSWSCLVIAFTLSGLASKFPGNLGPLPTEGAHRQWMTPQGEVAFGRPNYALGRLSLKDEIEKTQRLRLLGRYFRKYGDPEQTLLTPWPGALGYLSGMRVLDLFGRTTPLHDGDELGSWTRQAPVDLVAALELGADYILPGFLARSVYLKRDLPYQLTLELLPLDIAPTDIERARRIQSLLAGYELIVVPAPIAGRGRAQVLYLLRRRGLGLTPELTIALSGDEFTVDMHPGPGVSPNTLPPPQLAHLFVVAIDSSGERWSFNPRGGLAEEAKHLARTGLVLQPSAERPTRLYTGRLPADRTFVELRAVLQNPDTRGTHALSRVSTEASLEL